ncbi:MAG: DUF370 domain-containing protein [Clostridiales bacterium]|jgi:hypothetical protein|nr:DUF370 domain-containing protein [Clostridiales bacterium]
MFLHIGSDISVPVEDIALILGCEAGIPEITGEALNAMKSADAGGERRSVVLTRDMAYYSPIAKATLRKRLRELLELM